MKKIRYTQTGYIAKTIRLRNLKNVIIETGEENAFYPEENRFVLSKDNAKIAYNLLEECGWLETVDFTNFDFSEITSMCGWFERSYYLKEIIFPQNVVCKNLCNLRRCFRSNDIGKIDFSNWTFECPVDMEEFVVNCPLLESIKLPKMKVKDATRVIKSCDNLTKIEAPIELTPKAPISRLVSNCKNLEVLDVSKAKLYDTKFNQEVLLSNENLYKIPDDCVVFVG